MYVESSHSDAEQSLDLDYPFEMCEGDPPAELNTGRQLYITAKNAEAARARMNAVIGSKFATKVAKSIPNA